MMPKWIFDFSLAITIFIIFCRIYFSSPCRNRRVHYNVYIWNKQTYNSRGPIIFLRKEKIGFCYFMQVKYSSVN
jgi:hypothetical protein